MDVLIVIRNLGVVDAGLSLVKEGRIITALEVPKNDEFAPVNSHACGVELLDSPCLEGFGL